MNAKIHTFRMSITNLQNNDQIVIHGTYRQNYVTHATYVHVMSQATNVS